LYRVDASCAFTIPTGTTAVKVTADHSRDCLKGGV
jgi:hypothetical protein